MIGYLKGTPISAAPQRVLLDVHGVGYEVHISLSTFAELERHGTRSEVGLFIHTHVREGEIALFGFWTEREQRLFELLIGISGIGPRLARAVLSGLSAEELIQALGSGEAGRLRGIPGVGKKTAERMVLELSDKVRELAGDLPTAGLAPPTDREVASALANLGYKHALAENAVARARREHPEGEFHDLLRASLKLLSRA